MPNPKSKKYSTYLSHCITFIKSNGIMYEFEVL